MMRQCRDVLIVLRPRDPGKDDAKDLGKMTKSLHILKGRSDVPLSVAKVK